MNKIIVIGLLCLFPTLIFAKPITIKSCDRTVTFDKAPTRAVSHDVNLSEIMFALGLQKSMVGYSGVTAWHKLTPEFIKLSQGIPQLTEGYLNLENLLNVKADFLFAGWRYGMRAGGEVTPASLSRFGIKVYELTESCIRIMKKQVVSFDDIFNDLDNLGKIFRVEAKSQQLIKELKQELRSIEKIHSKTAEPYRVFLYDSGQEKPLTAGGYAMPQAMIEAAGGVNLTADLPNSWVSTNWETVSEKNPEIIVIVDYGKTTAEQKIAFLKSHPALQSTPAIKHERFVVITYAEATPGIKSVAATKRMAEQFKAMMINNSGSTTQ